MPPASPPPDRPAELLVAKRLELSPAQVTGSALAAVSGAFFASWAGTAGTLIGAAAGSVIATVGSATYTYSLRRTSSAVRRRAEQVRLHTGALPRPDAEEEKPARRPLAEALRQLPWAKVLVASAAVMVAALLVITGVEKATGRPVSSYTHGGAGSGTTLGHAVGADSSSDAKPSRDRTTPSPQPSTEPTTGATPTPSPGSGATPSTTPGASQTPEPTPSETAPTGSATPTPSPGTTP